VLRFILDVVCVFCVKGWVKQVVDLESTLQLSQPRQSIVRQPVKMSIRRTKVGPGVFFRDIDRANELNADGFHLLAGLMHVIHQEFSFEV